MSAQPLTLRDGDEIVESHEYFSAASVGEPGKAPRVRVAIVGLGYVGLPTALSLIGADIQVAGLDVSGSRIEAVKRLAVDLQPEELTWLRLALEHDALEMTTDPTIISGADGVIICVPTPVDDNLIPNLDALRSACATVVDHARAGQTIILTSTSYVGSTRDLLSDPLSERGFRPGIDIHVAFSPERIDPGSLGHAPGSAPRVLGGLNPASTAAARAILQHTASKIHEVSSPEAAELTKLHENIFRAVNLALVNEMADIATTLGVDITEVIEAAATKPYGFMRFTPGAGVGGHCIPCDPHYLLWQLRRERVSAPVLEQSMSSIARRPLRVIERAQNVLSQVGGQLLGSRVLVVGVAYKPGVADVRESPAVEIVKQLHRRGATVAITDSLISSMRLENGSTLLSVKSVDIDPRDYDLAIVHTRHPDTDHSWLESMSLVLDATFTMETNESVHRL